ncbi:MAG: hypothetical protein AAB729_00995 [Patescibacteria group bacterium]
MKERLVGGHHCLILEEEAGLHGLTDTELGMQIYSLLPSLSTAQLHQLGDLKKQLRMFNSLLWIYVQRDGVLSRVVTNIKLLWVLQGVVSINDFARRLDLNPSFTGRVLSGDDIGLGGWNLSNLMRMSGVLKVKPEVLLFSSLEKCLKDFTGMEESDYEKK